MRPRPAGEGASRRGGRAALRSAGVVFSLALAVGFASACEEEQPVATLPQDRTFPDADVVTTGGESHIYDGDGTRTAYLRFDTMFQWNDSTRHSLVGVDLVTYNEDDGTERGTVVAERGSFSPEDESLTAWGNVVLTVPGDQRRLETSEVHFDPAAEQLWSDSSFVMTLAGEAPVRGSAFTTDLEFRNFVVQGIGENDE